MIKESTFIKEYCLANQGGVFDISYLGPKVFPNISHDNLRQVCRRLAKNGLLKHIGKGFYLIGESEKTDEERLVDYFLFDGKVRIGMLTGESLFYELGLLSKKPEVVTLRSNKAENDERILNVQVKRARTPYVSGDLKTYELSVLLELLMNYNLLNKDNFLQYHKIRDGLVDSYSDEAGKLVWYDFPRVAYIKLAYCLDDMGISNQAAKLSVENPWNWTI